MTNHVDTGYAPGRWAFDDEVTRVFDDMLRRSIPQYLVMRDAVTSLGSRFIPKDKHSMVLDLGTSRGDQIAAFLELDRDAFYLGMEISEPMLVAATERFFDLEDTVAIMRQDLREGLDGRGGYHRGGMSLVTAVLTLMFIPVEFRQRLLEDIYDAVLPGGAFIMVEKILGAGSVIDGAMVEEYSDYKGITGYSADDIQRKRLALEGVLIPSLASSHMENLRSVGFRQVDCFWRWMNFAGFIGVK